MARNLRSRIRNLFRFPHKIAIDLTLWTLAAPLAFLVRFDGAVPERYVQPLIVFGLASLLVKAGAIGVHRLNLRSWRTITFRDAGVLASAVVGVMVVQTVLVWTLRPLVVVPVSIPIIDAGIGLSLLFFVRAARRWFNERARLPGHGETVRALIVGAGEAGTLLAREMQRHPEMRLEPVGFVDDSLLKKGMRIGSVPVLGTRADLEEILDTHEVDQVLIAVPTADGRFIRETIEAVRTVDAEIETRVMPGVYELLSGDVSIGRLREVQVEDLLRRAPVRLDPQAIRTYVRGRTVLVTGAGGSIGSEIVRQLAEHGPAKLLLLGRGENSVYSIHREMRGKRPNVPIEPIIASVRDRDRLEVLFERHRPDVVFHAAAHKHVPLMEAHPEEAILNNVVGTKNLIDVALAHGVRRFVNVSTDKAVNPTSVMGASKRLAECLVKDAASRAAADQEFISVRFGNVLGSRGSVAPLFREQIEAGGPVTITDAAMTRYFMTIPEASQLVLQAGALAENGSVYILDMGEPVRILDLAEDLIRLSGLTPHEDIEIREVGTRPGEKIHEELLTSEEERQRAVHEKIFVARAPDLIGPDLLQAVERLDAAARAGRPQEIMEMLQQTVAGSRLQALQH